MTRIEATAYLMNSAVEFVDEDGETQTAPEFLIVWNPAGDPTAGREDFLLQTSWGELLLDPDTELQDSDMESVEDAIHYAIRIQATAFPMRSDVPWTDGEGWEHTAEEFLIVWHPVTDTTDVREDFVLRTSGGELLLDPDTELAGSDIDVVVEAINATAAALA